MRALVIVLLALTAAALTAQSVPAPRRDIENVTAFARLYGVVRYFYPSDTAAAIDWNRFAVHGVNRARAARDIAELEKALESLFTPTGPGIEIGSTLQHRPQPGLADPLLVAWRYYGPGVDTKTPGPYVARRTNRLVPVKPGLNEFVAMVQSVPAAALRGKGIRLRGRVRVTNPDAQGSAGLWLRVDRDNQKTGFFDNMEDRPVRETEWREYAIEGTVAEDATNVAIGAIASGSVAADFDTMDLSVRDGDAAWTPIPIADAGFEAALDDPSAGWARTGTSRNALIARPTEGAAEGRRFLRLVAVSARGGPFETTAPTAGAHIDLDLAPNLRARVPLALTDADARVEGAGLTVLREAVASVPTPSGRSDDDVRLADVVVAWNVFRHFYPYWPEAGVDWDARLRPQLEIAYGATTREAHRRALRQLVAEVRDGHGTLNDVVREPRGALPVQVRVIEGRLVITASGVPTEAPIGAVVTAVDGVPAAERIAAETILVSGTHQWKQSQAVRRIASCPHGSVVRLAIETPGTAARESALPCNAKGPPPEKRPDAIVEMESGIWYVDLTRASMTQIRPVLEKLAGAAGVIFDVRGYPTDAGAQILPHLIDAAESDRWMHIAKITGPFGQIAGWQSFGWNLKPAPPRVPGKRVFLTDGRAISYAESVMGYVAGLKLGTVIGGATAGANGNVVSFGVPGGFTIRFTGMRVTGHDGQSPHHLAGVQPDIRLEPTLAALREGRDELVERALAVIRAARRRGNSL